MEREIAGAVGRLEGSEVGTTVLAEPGDDLMLGGIALESLGFRFDPVQRRLVLLPLLAMSYS
jgi:hypothetical protein